MLKQFLSLKAVLASKPLETPHSEGVQFFWVLQYFFFAFFLVLQ